MLLIWCREVWYTIQTQSVHIYTVLVYKYIYAYIQGLAWLGWSFDVTGTWYIFSSTLVQLILGREKGRIDNLLHYSDVMQVSQHLKSLATRLCKSFLSLTAKNTSKLHITVPLSGEFVWWKVDSPHKGPLIWKIFPIPMSWHHHDILTSITSVPTYSVVVLANIGLSYGWFFNQIINWMKISFCYLCSRDQWYYKNVRWHI